MAEHATPTPVDVIVVGAGLAGLCAARELRGSGRTVLVLEARDEVGGRTRSHPVEGAVVDFGAEWIGRAHRGVRGLVRELRLDVEPARNIGSPVLWRLPGRETCRRLPPAGVRRDLVRSYGRAVRDGRGIDPEQPWLARRAAEFDGRSVAAWLDDLDLGDDGRHVLERLIGSLACQTLDSMSLLHFLWLLRDAGGPIRSLHTTFQWRIVQGAQEIARRVAAGLGDAIRLNTPVERIVQDGDHVVVSGSEREYRAKRVIVAVPVTQVAHIEFDPPLPSAQRELSSLHIGAGTKVVALLPDGHTVRHNTVVGGDVLWSGWRRGDRITGFVPPAAADVPDETLCADLAAAFHAQPGQLRSATVFRWADQQHILGCDVAFAPGQVCRFGPLVSRPHGLVEFAGTERSSWPDNMEGAVRSGAHAAHLTLASL